MVIVYVLRSRKDKRFYVGCTNDLRTRFELHNKGRIASTKLRKPFDLVYYEACRSRDDALHREKYLKTTYGKRYIHNRIKHYLRDPAVPD
ncbi:GIY-YIG nuclease family protein [candidate division WOR-3 bacterium]|nr:GIY-YIG nuclease family protein [candidate division WOR-3 bacterium]